MVQRAALARLRSGCRSSGQKDAERRRLLRIKPARIGAAASGFIRRMNRRQILVTLRKHADGLIGLHRRRSPPRCDVTFTAHRQRDKRASKRLGPLQRFEARGQAGFGFGDFCLARSITASDSLTRFRASTGH